MLICGLKLTHDGSVALVKDGKLLFSIEMEKISNNPRYTEIEEMTDIAKILNENGYSIDDIDYFAVDGWGGDDQDSLAIQPRLEIGENGNKLSVSNYGKEYKINVNLYEEETLNSNVLNERIFEGLTIGDESRQYYSYLHVAGHILSTYSTSTFAKENQSSYILSWDGGMYPRLYFFDAKTNQIENLGPIFLFIGNIYTIFSQHFEPFKEKGNFAKDDLSIAGKVMAYIALGKIKRELFEIFDEIYTENYKTPMGFGNIFAREFKDRIAGQGYRDQDILASFHTYLEELLVEKVEKKVNRFDRNCRNICITGGCALNIKWNSTIRNHGIFDSVYVSPFPNDSGSAVGMACCCMLSKTGNSCLDWSVFSGPKIIQNEPYEGWGSRPCSIEEMALLLHEKNEPVVFLNERAELGPRALGNRSIIAAPVTAKMKDILNQVKKREEYRPVSPICMEDYGEEIFIPGTKDPFMLFDHDVKEEWKDKIPAVCHLDGTARLQTINAEQNSTITKLLNAYYELSGIPLLCNTSANYNGRGFFPDVYSATEWNKVNYVWCNHTLYEKIDKISF